MPPCPDCLTLRIVLILGLLHLVSSSGQFELQLAEFRNTGGVLSDGNCCHGVRSGGRCPTNCHTFFRLCLTHYQAHNISLETSCTYGSFETPVLGENTFDFPDALSTFSNPVKMPFDMAWPGTFSLIIEAWHDSTLNGPATGSPRELITRMIARTHVDVGDEWNHFVYEDTRTELQYSYRVRCDENYYGPDCQALCRPRDDIFGHYVCSENGTKVCLDGWTGNYCQEAVCIEGCLRGTCATPNECMCTLGWQGKFCDECILYPGCQHGTCEDAFQCTCDEDWGGLFCNQDLIYCTRYQPCHNGGTCQNIPRGSYTCSCPLGYNGTNCELEVDDCLHQPCLNGGTCMDTGVDYQCQCPPGFHGRHCQSSATSCEESPCKNGGSCHAQPDGYHCTCGSGFSGINCERETNECSSNPCQNGGRCIDEFDGFRCVCPSTNSGPTCEESHAHCSMSPCMNGAPCIERVSDFECRCVPGFVGILCQENVDDCLNRPCANGGTCHDLVNDFQCDCAPGFSGQDCRVNVDECAALPCMNGGTCSDRVNDYDCHCPLGYSGKNCQVPANGGPFLVTEAPVRTPPGGGAEETSSVAPVAGAHTEPESVVTMQQLLLIICLGVGIPIIISIVIIVFLLCSRRRTAPAAVASKESQENVINSMNNKNKCLDTNIINAIPPSNVCLKITNEEHDSRRTYRNQHIPNDVVEKVNNKTLNTDLNITNSISSHIKNDILDDRELKKSSRKVDNKQSSIEIDSSSSDSIYPDVVSDYTSRPLRTVSTGMEADSSNYLLFLERPRHSRMLATEV